MALPFGDLVDIEAMQRFCEGFLGLCTKGESPASSLKPRIRRKSIRIKSCTVLRGPSAHKSRANPSLSSPIDTNHAVTWCFEAPQPVILVLGAVIHLPMGKSFVNRPLKSLFETKINALLTNKAVPWLSECLFS